MSQLVGNKTLIINDDEFQEVRGLVYDYCGIYFNEGKEALVQSRVMKRVRRLGMQTFREYLDFVQSDKNEGEFYSLVDVLTTNKTNFFREAKHFDFIKKNVLPQINDEKLKWWSAGCSTGEEPITCAITLLEAQKHARILATDISQDVLKIARKGAYPASKMLEIPDPILEKYFVEDDGQYHPVNEIRKMITYGKLNLVEEWPMKGSFQLIMCRNVMIYFNRETQFKLINRFQQILEPGGYLFLGHSEGIPKEAKGFKNLAPAVYQKV